MVLVISTRRRRGRKLRRLDKRGHIQKTDRRGLKNVLFKPATQFAEWMNRLGKTNGISNAVIATARDTPTLMTCRHPRGLLRNAQTHHEPSNRQMVGANTAHDMLTIEVPWHRDKLCRNVCGARHRMLPTRMH